jgi:hypothetical protein
VESTINNNNNNIHPRRLRRAETRNLCLKVGGKTATIEQLAVFEQSACHAADNSPDDFITNTDAKEGLFVTHVRR